MYNFVNYLFKSNINYYTVFSALIKQKKYKITFNIMLKLKLTLILHYNTPKLTITLMLYFNSFIPNDLELLLQNVS